VEAERLDQERPETMRRVFAFLDVDPGFRSPAFERRWNVTARQRGARYRALVKVRKVPGWDAFAQRVPQRALWLAERATRRREASSRPKLTPSSEFVDSLREDAARFRELTGLELDYWQV
jgi:hypothetical protein